jgi:microsomal dipeptidase-like Zn-dependent dipeptidase
MEWIAKTGGVVCTWPFAYVGKLSERTTLQHWAEEIAMMKSRLGIEHCGLGTDGGGNFLRGTAQMPGLVQAAPPGNRRDRLQSSANVHCTTQST